MSGRGRSRERTIGPPARARRAEFLGRENGAYTGGALTRQVGRFEVADGSTFFLDEVGELSLGLQAQLLRVPKAGEFERLGSPKTVKVGARLIAATNRDLTDEIRNGGFREGLYRALERAAWRIEGPNGAAAALGLNPSTLYTRMKKWASGRAHGQRTAGRRDAIPTREPGSRSTGQRRSLHRHRP